MLLITLVCWTEGHDCRHSIYCTAAYELDEKRNENPALLRHRVKDLFKTRPRTYTILQRRLAHARDSSRSSVACPVNEDRSPIAEDFSKSWDFESALKFKVPLLLLLSFFFNVSLVLLLAEVCKPTRCSSTGYQYSELLFYSCLFFRGSSWRG